MVLVFDIGEARPNEHHKAYKDNHISTIRPNQITEQLRECHVIIYWHETKWESF